MYNKEQLQHYADLGLSITETAFKLEADRTSVNRYAKKFEVTFIKKRIKTDEKTISAIKQEIKFGKTNRQIVEMLNISTATISKIRRKMNGEVSRPRKKKQIMPEKEKTSVKVREFDLKLGDTFELVRSFERKKYNEIFTVIQLTDDLIVGRNSKGLVESFQVKEYEYGLI